MTIRLPIWLVWIAGGVVVIAIAVVAFLFGRSSDNEQPAPQSVLLEASSPAESAVSGPAEEASCSKATAEKATRQSTFDDAIRRTSVVQGYLNGTAPAKPRFFTKYATDHQIAVLKCGDLTGDGVDEMVVGIAAGAAGRIFQWAIFTPNSDGNWMLAFDSEGTRVSSIRIRANSVVTRVPTYGLRDALCCPSGYKTARVVFRGGKFQVASAARSAEERRVSIADGQVTRLADFSPLRDSPVQALAKFGTPTSIINYPDELCRFDWSDIGLSIAFANFGTGDPCGADGRVGSFDLVGRPAEHARWRTVAGARIGMSVAVLSELFPGARRHGSQLTLMETPSPYGEGGTTDVLSAYNVDGIAMAFRFYVGAAGE